MKSRLLRHRISLCLCLALGLGSPAIASPIDFAAIAGGHDPLLIPVVVFGDHGRETIAQFAATQRLNPAAVRRRHAASGIVQCGDAHGAGQLTLADNVITTAAHVFFDETGARRAKTCVFELMLGDGREIHVPIDSSSIVAGSRNPYAVAVVDDWAVAKLKHRIDGPRPYRIADHIGLGPVEFAARGHVDWGDARRLSLQKCRLRRLLARGAEGTREFAFDCDTADGASGGAVLSGETSDKLMAVLVGYRSISPNSALPFSNEHYNFVVSVEGAFRAAAEKAAAPAAVSLATAASVKSSADQVPPVAQESRSAHEPAP